MPLTPPDKVEVSLDPERLDHLYPAYMLVNADGALVSYGRFYKEHGCPVFRGALLQDLFVAQSRSMPLDLARLARNGDPLTLRSVAKAMSFSGSVIETGNRYLLAINVVPDDLAMQEGRLKISDFAPDDPAVQNMLMLQLQRAMIEESRSIAEELAVERQRSLYLLERVRRVTGYMAHDFNNYLSIIKLNSDRLLMGGNLDDADERLVRIIIVTAARGSEITQSLMTLSNQKTDARQLLSGDELIRIHQPYLAALAGHDIELELKLDAPDALIEVSRMMFTNSIINLVTNSREAGSRRVTVATRVVETAIPAPGKGTRPEVRPYYAVRVTDDGPGIPPAMIAQVFQPLFSTKERGSGLGLASILDFVNEAGGDACVDSGEGTGTSVFLYLPLAETCREAGTALADPADAEAPRGKRILVVEDEPYALEALIELLETNGFAASGAGDAATALDLARSGQFDVLLTDIILPGASGTELARQIQHSSPATRIALMSGYVPEADEIPAGWHFIRKPLDARALIDLVNETLRSRG